MNRFTRGLLCCTAGLIASMAAMPARAQSNDEDAVRAVVDELFDAMAVRDTATMRTLFAQDARFAGVGRDGTVAYTMPADFLDAVGSAPDGPALVETLYDVEVRVDGPLATVWTYYTLHLDEQFSHCGYDAIQLLKLAGEWKIVHLADTRRRDGCRYQELPTGT